MKRLRVAVVHYHLRRGGVTRVIESTLDSFEEILCPPVDCVVIAGEVPAAFKHREKAIELDGLRYSNQLDQTPDPKALLQEVRDSARTRLGGDPDLWHIHNHSLGKNSSMPGLVALLVRDGCRVLLHMHDFAEDGRPENYLLNKKNEEFADSLYPDAANAHYGFINSRDREVFRKAGIPAQRLHYLGNPIGGPGGQPDPDVSRKIRSQLDASRLFLYPVRAVRRKNFGEMLLWAALAGDGDMFATTLGPTNPDYVPRYREWKAFAKDLRLPVRFSIGESGDLAFPDVVHAADYILNTSIAEGFGLTFLEPFLFGKMILGRNLPDVTVDFKGTGLPMDHLYNTLPIPAEWINQTELEDKTRNSLLATYGAYNTEPPEGFVEQAISGITTDDGNIDFGGLDESMQQSVIRRIVEDPGARRKLPLNQLIPEQPPSLFNLNLDAFNPASYAKNILESYRALTASGSRFNGFFDADKILREYLKPERFRLLRT